MTDKTWYPMSEKPEDKGGWFWFEFINGKIECFDGWRNFGFDAVWAHAEPPPPRHVDGVIEGLWIYHAEGQKPMLRFGKPSASIWDIVRPATQRDLGMMGAWARWEGGEPPECKWVECATDEGRFFKSKASEIVWNNRGGSQIMFWRKSQ